MTNIMFMKKLLAACLFMVSLLNASYVFSANTEISQKTYKKISAIQELISEENYAEALVDLKDLEESLSPSYGLALVLQLHAQTLLAQDSDKNLNQAQGLFIKALDLNALPLNQEVGLAANVAQLYLAQEKLDDAIKTLSPRLSKAEKDDKAKKQLSAQPYIVLGASYQLKQNYKQAITWLEKGIALADAKKSKVQENWLQMLMASYYQLKNYPKAIAVLDRLITVNPSKEDYWLQQASMYQMLDDSKNALVVLETAYVRNILTKKGAFTIFVQLLIQEEIPDRAGRILSKLLDEGKIELTEKKWKLLASAWLQARERNLAANALLKAAEIQKDGVVFYRVAQLELENQNYAKSAELFQKARQVGLNSERSAYSLLFQGNACHQAENFKCAREYFLKAQKEPITTTQAKAWLDYMMQMDQL